MRFCLMILGLALALQTKAQTNQFTKFLVVDRIHSPKRYRYVPTKLIHLKQDDGERKYGPITKILDSSIVIINDTISLNKIKVVYLDDKAKAPKLLSDVLITYGIGYFAISTFNRTINDDAPMVHRSSYHFGIPALTLGFMIKLLVKPKVRIKQPSQLKIIDLELK